MITANSTMSDSWLCSRCHTSNQPEDRYCGKCGGARNATIVGPVIRTAADGRAMLSDIKEAPPRLGEGAALVLLAGPVAALAFGALYHYVSRVIDIMVVFPVLLGFAVAWALRVAAIRGRCRHAGLLLAVSLAAGAAAYGVRQSLETAAIQNQMHRFLAQKSAEDLLVSERATRVHFSYLDAWRIRATVGMEVGSLRSSSRQIKLQGAAFWIFLLVEMVIVAGVAAAATRSILRLPTCAGCRALVPSLPVFRVNARDSDRLSDALRRQQWKEAQELSNRAAPTPTDRAEATLLRCADCDASAPKHR